MYELETKTTFEKTLKKLEKKDKKKVEIILKKVEEILQNPHHYKNLRSPKQQFKRAHIDAHFVLLFSVNDDERTVILEAFKHHDKIYE